MSAAKLYAEVGPLEDESRLMSAPVNDLSFGARFFFAWSAFFRILLDGKFAARAFSVRDALPAAQPEAPPPAPPAPLLLKNDPTAALTLLQLLQRDGRFIDFIEQDVVGFSDADIGAAVRVVHEGCRKVLRSHGKLLPVRAEEEETKVRVEAGYKPAEIKLTGNVQGSAPFNGTLKHKGWKMTDFTLPEALPDHDATVIAPAEVEL